MKEKETHVLVLIQEVKEYIYSLRKRIDDNPKANNDRLRGEITALGGLLMNEDFLHLNYENFIIKPQQYIKQLEDALKEAVNYEEGCRKVMCDVNKEFGIDLPKELAWVSKAKQALQSKNNGYNRKRN